MLEYWYIERGLLDTHVICMTIMITLMASYAMFCSVFITEKFKALHTFLLKKNFSTDILIPKFVIDTINW